MPGFHVQGVSSPVWTARPAKTGESVWREHFDATPLRRSCHPNQRLLSFKERPQHPGHFLVLFHQTGQEVSRASIVILLSAGFEIQP
jgi:hypothetical protein